jgi:ATP-dependent DNA helicase RecQ
MDRFKKDNIPAYMIMHQSTLLAIASHIPQTKKELLSIKGFGEASFKKYGEEILSIIDEFSK